MQHPIELGHQQAADAPATREEVVQFSHDPTTGKTDATFDDPSFGEVVLVLASLALAAFFAWLKFRKPTEPRDPAEPEK